MLRLALSVSWISNAILMFFFAGFIADSIYKPFRPFFFCLSVLHSLRTSNWIPFSRFFRSYSMSFIAYTLTLWSRDSLSLSLSWLKSRWTWWWRAQWENILWLEILFTLQMQPNVFQFIPSKEKQNIFQSRWKFHFLKRLCIETNFLLIVHVSYFPPFPLRSKAISPIKSITLADAATFASCQFVWLLIPNGSSLHFLLRHWSFKEIGRRKGMAIDINRC